MSPEQVVAIRTMIKEAWPYAKLDSDTGDEVWFVILQEYKYKPMYDAVIHFIKGGNKFAPSLPELIKLYEEFNQVELSEVVQFMEEKGYFNDPDGSDAETAMWNHQKRLNKTMMFIESGTVPEWLQRDINKYYRMLHPTKIDGDNKKQLETR